MMDLKPFEKFTQQLTAQFSTALPGEAAQLLMGSDIRMEELKFSTISERSQKSGVLILLYPHNNTIYSVLIQRTIDKSVHSGQVSFPGGKYEKVDQTTINTALRETAEEIGIDSSNVHVVGELTKLFIPPSNFIVFPTVGYMWKRPTFTPNPKEVHEIIEYPIALLQDSSIIKKKIVDIRKDFSFTAPYFDINGYVVWGATAMILSEFSAMIKDIKIP